MVWLESAGTRKRLAGVRIGGAVVVASVMFCGCGYQVVSPDVRRYGGSFGYCVRSSDAPSIHPNTVAWLRAGALDVLSQWNLAGRCDGGPTIVLGPAQVSFDATAVVDGAARTDGSGWAGGVGAPVARASRVMVRAEARVACCDCGEASCAKADSVKEERDSLGSGRFCHDARDAMETCGRRFFSQGQQIVASERSAPGHIVSMDAAVQRAAWEAGQRIARQIAMSHVPPVRAGASVPQRVEIQK